MQNKNTDFSGTDQEYVYAGFWVRFAAFTLDSLILFAGTLIIKLLFSLISLLTGTSIFDTEILFSYTLKDIIVYGCHAIYFVLLTYYTGATLGKKAFNLKVIPCRSLKDENNVDDNNTNEQLTLINVVYRETIGRYLSGIILYIGYLLAGLDQEKRALHDILCDTRVIYPEYQPPIMPDPGYNISSQQPLVNTSEYDNFDYDINNRPHE